MPLDVLADISSLIVQMVLITEKVLAREMNLSEGCSDFVHKKFSV